MGRPQKKLDLSLGPAAEFAAKLRHVRALAGDPTFDAMARHSQYTKPSLSNAAAGKKMPSWPVTRAFLLVCGVGEENLGQWEERWKVAKAQDTEYRRAAGKTAAESPEALPTIPRMADVRIGHGPDPREAITLAEFLGMLDALRAFRQLNMRDLVRRSAFAELRTLDKSSGAPAGLTHSWIAAVLRGKTEPSTHFVRLYVNACGQPAAEVEVWVQQLRRLRRTQQAITEITQHSRTGSPQPPGAAPLEIKLVGPDPLLEIGPGTGPRLEITAGIGAPPPGSETSTADDAPGGRHREPLPESHYFPPWLLLAVLITVLMILMIVSGIAALIARN